MSFQYDASTQGMSEHAVRANAAKLARSLRDIREDYVRLRTTCVKTEYVDDADSSPRRRRKTARSSLSATV
jgi:hypothetical protein